MLNDEIGSNLKETGTNLTTYSIYRLVQLDSPRRSPNFYSSFFKQQLWAEYSVSEANLVQGRASGLEITHIEWRRSEERCLAWKQWEEKRGID